MTRPKTVRVIGVGSPYRSDDAVGLLAVRRVQERLSGHPVEVREIVGDLTSLLDAWEGADLAIVVDAVVSGGVPGTVHRFDVGETPLPATMFATSTHALNVAQAVELGRALGRFPHRLVLYGVEVCRLETGSGLSPEVEKALPQLVEAVCQEVIRALYEPP